LENSAKEEEMRKVLIPLFCLLFLFLTLGHVEAKDYVWTNVRVDLTLEKDGTILVEETRSLRFWGNYHYAYLDLQKNKISGIDEVSVWEENLNYREEDSGRPGTFQVIDSPDLVSIYWYYDYADTERTFHLRYRILGAPQLGTISFYSDFDQFYFKAIGADHDKPMQVAEVYIHIPPGAKKEDLHLWGYGPDLGTGTVEVLDEHTAYLKAAPLPPDVGIECRLLFPVGLIEKPDTVSRNPGSILAQVQAEQAQVEQRARLARLLQDIEYIVALALAILLPIFLFVLWYFKGREYRYPAGTAMISGPPSGLAPAGVEALWNQGVSVKGIVATLFHLAHRGFLEIREEGKDFLLTLKQNPGDLQPFEKSLLSLFFPGSGRKEERTVRLSSLKRKLGDHLGLLQRKVWDYLEPFHFFEGDPQKIRGHYLLISSLLFFGGLALFFWAQVIILGLSLIWCSFFVFLFGMIMPRRSVTGAREAAAWRAFRLYMEELMRRPQLAQPTQVFSEYLPYAIVFGISKKWTRALSAKAGFQSPDWWYGGGVTAYAASSGASFSRAFSSAISDFYSRVSSSFSTSSSGNGGGFSGGGGGGGGGGGSGAG
jgi:uncharacterized membrane protein